MVVGAVFSMAWRLVDYRPSDPLDALFAATCGAMFGIFAILPLGVFHLGLVKAREQRQRAIAALGDDNTVTADPDGPRKLHEYLSAITSTEARIGLLQRSEPYSGDKPQS